MSYTDERRLPSPDRPAHRKRRGKTRKPFGLAEVYFGARRAMSWVRWYATERQLNDAARGLKSGGWWSQPWIKDHFVGPVSRLP